MPKIYTKTNFKKSFVSITKAAKFLQVSPDTLRNWEKEGKLVPARTTGGARRYSREELEIVKKEFRPFASHKKGLVNISNAAKALRVSPDTLRNWDRKGLIESERSKGGARRFTRDEIQRLQKELGIKDIEVVGKENIKSLKASTQLLLTAPKSGHGFHNFFNFWLRIAVLIFLFLGANWFIDNNIVPIQKKLNETFQIASEAVKSIESLQRGVLGIQTKENVQGPEKTASTITTNSANYYNSVVYAAAKAPLTFDTNTNQVGCISCLTDKSLYIASINNTDGAFSFSLDEKTATIFLDVNHPNTWSTVQNFNGGIAINTQSVSQLFQLNSNSSNPVVMTATGNVGIGITSPVNKLDVAGGEVIGSDYAGAYTAPVNGLLVQGNVGIGISAPSYHLDVAGGARFGCGDTNWNNGPVTDCSDVAELYQSDGSVSVGEIVVAGAQNIVSKSNSSYQKGIIGVYSTSPGLLVGGQTIIGGGSNLALNQIPVALSGRVPVKVSDENGAIQIGDYLTSSSVPGVAMKATKPGPVIGQALEQIDFATGGPLLEGSHLVDIKMKFGTVLAFINVSFADPKNILASFTMDDQGNLIIPKLKAGSIVLDPSIASASSQLALNNDQLLINAGMNIAPSVTSLASETNRIDLSEKIALIETRIKDLEAENVTQQAKIKDLQNMVGNVGIGTTAVEVHTASRSALLINSEPQISSGSATSSASLLSGLEAVELNLTPPDILLATGSASLADLSVTGTLSSDKLFKAQDAKISGDLSVFGKTILAKTNIAGDLTVDGTLSINGNSINSIGSPTCSEGKSDCGILYLQNSPLAYQVNFFNGLVTIDKTGVLRAQTVIVAEFKTVANKISGTAKIAAGEKSVDLENPLVKSSSRILITPTSETEQVLAVTNKEEGKKFTVSSAQKATKDLIFDWFMVNETLE